MTNEEMLSHVDHTLLKAFAKWEDIKKLCEEWEVPLIEDAAESLGSSIKGRNAGTFGDFGILSFNGNKIITTSGGGMLLSKNEEQIDRARFLSTQSREPARHYEHKEIGYNYRMSNIVAGIGRGQLLHLMEHVEKKTALYQRYRMAFSEYDFLTMNPVPEDCLSNYWLSCVTIAPGEKLTPLSLMLALEKENIESRPIWKPMHLQPVFQSCPFVKVEELAVSEDIFERGLCLPSDIKNTEEDMDRILSILKQTMELQKGKLR